MGGFSRQPQKTSVRQTVAGKPSRTKTRQLGSAATNTRSVNELARTTTESARTTTEQQRSTTEAERITTEAARTNTELAHTNTELAHTNTELARTNTEEARTTTEAMGAATGLRTATRNEVAGFVISFSVPIRGGLNAGSAAPQNL